MNKLRYTLPQKLSELANICGGDVVGDSEIVIQQFCSIQSLQDDSLTFINNKNLLKLINNNIKVSYIIKPDWYKMIRTGIIHNNPMQAFRIILDAIFSPRNNNKIASTAKISMQANIGRNVGVGHYSIVEENVVLGSNCSIGNNSNIANDSIIGENTHIGNNVNINHNCIIGKNCIIADGAVIGGQGFGFSFEDNLWHPIKQIGKVIIGDNVHIGNNSCIDRGAINDTIIGNNVILDNLVHIAHNVIIADGCAMAAGVGIAGSTTIGKHCFFGGQVGVVGHINICDNVQINGGARVLRSIKDPGSYSGSLHVMPETKWNKAAVYFKKIENLFKRENK